MRTPPRFVRVGIGAFGAWFFIVIGVLAIVGFVSAIVGTVAGLR